MAGWENYERLTQKILNDPTVRMVLEKKLGICVINTQSKQKKFGLKTKTEWEIDALGYDRDNNLILIECKHYSKDKRKDKKIEQNTVAAFAYIIQDVGAKGGIIVSPLTLRPGAKKVAEAENIFYVPLAYHSTEKCFYFDFEENKHLFIQDPLPTANLRSKSFVTTDSYPFYKGELEQVKKRLRERTGKTEFSDDEISEVTRRMREENQEL